MCVCVCLELTLNSESLSVGEIAHQTTSNILNISFGFRFSSANKQDVNRPTKKQCNNNKHSLAILPVPEQNAPFDRF